MSRCVTDSPVPGASSPWIMLGLAFGLSAGSLAAQDGQVTVTTSGPNGASNSTTVTATPGSTVQVNVNGSVITTTTTTSDGVQSQSQSTEGLTLTTGVPTRHPGTTDATPSRWDLDWFAGTHFGGIIGASIDNALTYDFHGAVMPELTGDVGIGGATIGLGARWFLSKKQWTLSSNHLSFDYDSFSAITLRAIAAYRWEDHQGHPSFWRGMPSDGGWYRGGELDVMVDGLTLAGQVTWESERHDPGPHYTLSYGFGF